MPARPPTIQQCRAALAVARGYFGPTPLRLWQGLHLKLESRAPSGSFKVRGALAACAEARRTGLDEVVAASSGNHGKGLVWAGKALGVGVTVVVPRHCPSVKREAIAVGATVIVCSEPGYDAAEAMARELAAQRGVPFVSPSDDTLVIAANGGGVALELAEQLGGEPLDLFVPVGGGGLLAGILVVREALRLDWRIIAVQPQAAPAFFCSLRDRVAHEHWPAAPTLAEGLEGGTGATGVELALERGVECLLVDEDSIGRAMIDLNEGLGELVEGSAAVTVAAHRILSPTRRRAAIISGGNVATATIETLRLRLS
jgi:threonine dehydratase